MFLLFAEHVSPAAGHVLRKPQLSLCQNNRMRETPFISGWESDFITYFFSHAAQTFFNTALQPLSQA